MIDDAEIERRKPVWIALSDLWLDTELTEDDLRRTFNLGIGMVFVVPSRKLGAVKDVLKKIREPFYEIGRVVERKSRRQTKVLYQ